MILGLDIGTTTVAGVLFDSARQQTVHTVSQRCDAEVAGLPSGWHEECPRKILTVAMDVVRSLAAQTVTPVTRIALTGQMHGILAIDADLNPLTHLITWRDQRTAIYPTSLQEHTYASTTGCFLHPGYGGLTLHHWLQTGTLPENTHQVLSIAGFIAASLTGRCAVDETFAASWGIWDVRKNAWHNGVLKELGIPTALLPPYVPSCSELGIVLDSCGLGLAAGARVYSPLGDNQAGVAGVLEADHPEAVVNLGTSGQLSVPLADYAFTPQLETRPRPGRGFMQIYAALCGGWSYTYLATFFQQAIEQFDGKKMTISEVMAAMDGCCQSLDTAGLQVDTRFAGERHGPRRCGEIAGIDTENLTPGNLIRGVVCGMAAELATAANEVDLSGISGLVAVGNAVRKNPLLLTALEQQFGLPCRLATAPEEAATGAVKSVLFQSERTSQ